MKSVLCLTVQTSEHRDQCNKHTLCNYTSVHTLTCLLELTGSSYSTYKSSITVDKIPSISYRVTAAASTYTNKRKSHLSHTSAEVHLCFVSLVSCCYKQATTSFHCCTLTANILEPLSLEMIQCRKSVHWTSFQVLPEFLISAQSSSPTVDLLPATRLNMRFTLPAGEDQAAERLQVSFTLPKQPTALKQLQVLNF